MRGMTERLGGVSGALFAVLFLIGMNFLTDSPDSDASDDKWADYVNDGGNLVRNIVGAYLVVIAAVLLLVFIAAAYRRFHAAEGGDGIWSLIFMLSGVSYAVLVMVSATLIAAVPGSVKFGSVPEPSPELARWLSSLGFGVLLLAGGLCAALMSATAGALILRTKALPVWLGYFAFLAALAMAFAVVFIPMIVFVVWMLVLGIVMAMSSGETSPPMA